VLRAQDGLERAARPPLTRHAPVDGRGARSAGRQGLRPTQSELGRGRVIRTEITKAGSRALERWDRAVDDLEREMLGDLDADEVTTIHDILIRCGRALEYDLPARASR